ncbi:hypothetical protein CN221_35960 [Sinorhizobium meliloti]|nr:hypothetical protein SMRU11_31375 [Sinorhizobium meliloti RU11/001]PST24849.1 hypothetical protein C7U62_17125 [Mesorhizobium loti]RVG58288.1 hypothetical protein CN222_30730 [Sinorhizobium meliloti]RVG82649.1 hypothetical protein CN221_35960 [Sinorhizobium meliloti]RVH42875.1 hypothetical protein CN213_36540 [Sinorhizobium meliloti]
MATTPAMTESGSIIFKRVDMPATSGWDITAQSPAHRDSDQGLPLKAIHLPGEETESGFRVFGYGQKGQTLEYL